MKKQLLMLLLFCLQLANFNAEAQVYGWKEVRSATDSLGANGPINATCTGPGGKIYAAGSFLNGTGQYYVAEWTGNVWKELRTATDSLNTNGTILSICTDKIGNVYAAGNFRNANNKYYVAKWNGVIWKELCTATDSLNANFQIRTICTDKSGANLYAAGTFYNSAGKPYVARWNGTVWSELRSPTDSLNATGGDIYTVSTNDVNGSVYAAGDFVNANNKHYVAEWNGTVWKELCTLTDSLKANTTIYASCTDKLGNVYAAGGFQNAAGYQYVAQWNGAVWKELCTPTDSLKANAIIYAICADKLGNVYAGGQYTNASGYQYVAQWNGTTWKEVRTATDSLGATGTIYSVMVDSTGNIFAAGNFTKSGQWYVAEYGILNTTIVKESLHENTISIFPNPASSTAQILFKYNGKQETNINVYDVLGNQMKFETLEMSQGKIQIGINSWPAGIYFINVQNQHIRLVKE